MVVSNGKRPSSRSKHHQTEYSQAYKTASKPKRSMRRRLSNASENFEFNSPRNTEGTSNSANIVPVEINLPGTAFVINDNDQWQKTVERQPSLVSSSSTSKNSKNSAESKSKTNMSTSSTATASLKDNNNNQKISRREKLAKFQKSTIFEEPTQEELDKTKIKSNKKWAWHTKALKSQIVFDDPKQEEPKEKKYPWDQRESWILKEAPADSKAKKKNCKPWPWQERAAQSQVFANRVHLERDLGPVQNGFVNNHVRHIFPWDQRRSFGLRPLREEDLQNNNVILTPNENTPHRPQTASAAVNNSRVGHGRTATSIQSRYQMDFKRPPPVGHVIIPAGKSSGYVEEDYYQKMAALRISAKTNNCNEEQRDQKDVQTIVPSRDSKFNHRNASMIAMNEPRIKEERVSKDSSSSNVSYSMGNFNNNGIPLQVTVKTENFVTPKPEVIVID